MVVWSGTNKSVGHRGISFTQVVGRGCAVYSKSGTDAVGSIEIGNKGLRGPDYMGRKEVECVFSTE